MHAFFMVCLHFSLMDIQLNLRFKHCSNKSVKNWFVERFGTVRNWSRGSTKLASIFTNLNSALFLIKAVETLTQNVSK